MIVSDWFRRLWYLINRRRLERELEQDMETHRELMGEPRHFGNVLRLREESRDAWGWNWLDDLSHDLRIASQQLRQSPGFTAGSVLVLSLGLGLSLSMFQLFNAATMKPVPVRDVNSLVQLNWKSKDGRSRNVLYPSVPMVRARTDVLSTILTQNPAMVLLGDDSKPVLGAFVSANWFEELGYGPAFGRVLHEGTDDKPGAEPVVVVSYGFWERELARNPAAVGQTIRINNRSATVAGIAPATFPGVKYERTQIWLPVAQIEYFTPGSAFKTSWDENTILYGRLRAGISVSAAREALRGVFDALVNERPELFQKGDWLEPFPGSDRFLNPAQRQRDQATWGTMTGLTLLVLLIACANLGNLILSRSLGRIRELSIRVALGAGRNRIIRHLLAESLLLSAMGLAGAFVAGYWGLHVAFSVAITANPTYPVFEMDWRLSLAAVCGTIFVTLAIGLLPALRISRADLIASMKDGGQQTTAGLERTGLRSTLVAVQVGGTCVFLLLAGLMLRGFQRLQSDPGYQLENLAVLDLARDRNGPKGEEARAYWTAIRQTVAAHPQARSVALVSHAPLGITGTSIVTWPKDVPGLRITFTEVEPSFFELMQIPLLAGRLFDATDDPQTTVLISRRVAMEMFGTLNVIGKGYPTSKPLAAIAGVVEDARVVEIEETDGGQMYMPLNWKEGRSRALLIRANNDPEALVAPLKDAARAYDDRFIPEVRLVKTEYADRLRDERNRSLAVAGVASLSLLLATLGIFSVVSYGATLRRKEIGIRLALGADKRAIAQLLMKQLMRPVCIATPIGLGLGLIIGKSVGPNVKIYDPLLLVSLVLIVVVTAAAASLAPTLRAIRVDVLQALRYE